MPKAQMQEAGTSGDIIPDDSWLLAELTNVREKTGPKKDGGTWTKWLWKFVIKDPTSPHDGQVVYGETWPDFNDSPDNVIRQWVSEIMAVELPKGFDLDTDSLLGELCRINVGVREFEKGGEVRQINEVVNVLRAPADSSREPF